MAATATAPAGVAVTSRRVAVGKSVMGVAVASSGVAVGEGGLSVAEGARGVTLGVVELLRSIPRLFAVVVTVSMAAASMLADLDPSGEGVDCGAAASLPTAATVG